MQAQKYRGVWRISQKVEFQIRKETKRRSKYTNIQTKTMEKTTKVRKGGGETNPKSSNNNRRNSKIEAK